MQQETSSSKPVDSPRKKKKLAKKQKEIEVEYGADILNLPDNVLDKSRAGLVQRFKQRSERYNEQQWVGKTKRIINKPNTRYSDELLISYRSACVAKERLKTNSITFADIAAVHDIPAGYANQLRNNVTIRPHCLPNEDQVEAFIKEFRAGIQETRVIKAQRETNKQTIEDVQKVAQRTETLDFKQMMKVLYRHYQAYPTNVLDGLIMLQDLLRYGLVSFEWGEVAAQLLCINLVMLEELDIRNTPARITNRPVVRK